jgi:hypothetical protein
MEMDENGLWREPKGNQTFSIKFKEISKHIFVNREFTAAVVKCHQHVCALHFLLKRKKNGFIIFI